MDILSNPVLFLALALVLTLFTIQILRKNQAKKKYPPVAGTIFNQLLNFKRLHHYMTDLAAKYTTYRLLSPFRHEIYTSDPVNVEYILKTNFENYGKGSYNYNILKDLLGDGIFAVDGEKWRQQRKISSYEFSTKVLRDFSSLIFGKNAAKLAKILSEVAATNQTIDIQDMSMKAILDSMFQVAFGVELDSMCGSSEEGKKFSIAFDDASAMTLFRYVDIFWKIKKILNIGAEASMKKKIKIINDFVFKIIRKKIELMESSKDKSLEKVVIELREVTKAKEVTNFVEFAETLSEEVVEKMQYLHAAITETLRIYPAVPVDGKICLSDDKLPDGYSVRKGDLVVYQPYAMGRMKCLWGDDAEQFRPERWLNEKGVFQPQSPFKFTAFQAGPRICLGKEFAYRQLKIFAAVLLSYFEFKLSDEKKIAHYRTMINLHIDGGLQVCVLHRNRT
ncbi:cytochrome P450 704C1-like isoform X2 [Humulus lupulus]|uniref:cytochrome P450 704C1-like isoform X2 n=1 Tax=Humulus lupulus TaxID=3486 RepID=UPI002B40F99D|nr:cytochrome P450 704C1-like isoform X2 [Humulus lupulus]